MRSWEAAGDLLREWEGRGAKTVLMPMKDAIERFLKDAEARHLSAATIGTSAASAGDPRGRQRYPTKNSFGHHNRARLRAFVLLLRCSGLRIRDAVCLRRDRLKHGRTSGSPPVVLEAFAVFWVMLSIRSGPARVSRSRRSFTMARRQLTVSSGL